MNSMFSALSQSEDEPIIRPPNKYLKILEKLRWRYLIVVGGLILLLLVLMPQPTTESEAIYNSALDPLYINILVLGFLFYLIFVFFFWGFKAGLGVYKPQECYLSPKLIKKANQQFAKGEQYVVLSADGKIVKQKPEKHK